MNMACLPRDATNLKELRAVIANGRKLNAVEEKLHYALLAEWRGEPDEKEKGNYPYLHIDPM